MALEATARSLAGDTRGLARCVPAVGLSVVGVYSIAVLASFLVQQLAFVVLVEHGLPPRRGANGEESLHSDARLWLLRHVLCITYWRRQRAQLLRGART